MFKKTTLWSVVLLIGTLLSYVDRAEGVVFGIRPPQKFCSSKLALQIEKWTLSDNDLRYLMKHAVPVNSIKENHKTTSINISTGLEHTAVYTIEGLSGLIGTYVGSWSGIFITAMLGYVLLPRLGFDIDPESPTYRLYSFLLVYYPLTAIGAATGTTCTGKILRQKGSFTKALIGSAVPTTAIAFLEYLRHKDLFETPWLEVLFFPCVSAGAVIGYNYELLKSDKRQLLYCLIGCTLSSLAYVLLAHP